jgi:CHAT domain-containing protein
VTARSLGLALSLLVACRHRADPPRALPELVREQATLAARGDHRAALEVAEAIKCRRVQSLLAGAGVASHLATLDRARLPPLAEHEAVFSLYAVDGKLQRTIVRGASQVRALPPVDLARLEPLLIKARDELEHGPLDGERLFGLLARLHSLLLGEATDVLRDTRRLLVLPDGLTLFLPIHALVTALSDRGGPRFLIEDVSVAYAPCLGLVREATRAARAEIFAPSYRGAPDLLGAQAESRRIAHHLPSTLRVGGEATPRRLEDALRAPHSVVHFAGHGLADLTPGSPPQLLFPDNQRSVTLRSAAARPASAALVVLASCTAAYAARFRDDQRLLALPSLVEALLDAGVRRVVAASWAVKDQQSAEQMAIFYARLRSDAVVDAIAAAQRRAITRIRPPHPRFWAFYAVYGGF